MRLVIDFADMEAAQRAWERQEMTIAEAAEWSRYSEDHLRELVRDGRLPDQRPPGSQGRIQVRRCDLPLKARGHGSSVVADMADHLSR